MFFKITIYLRSLSMELKNDTRSAKIHFFLDDEADPVPNFLLFLLKVSLMFFHRFLQSSTEINNFTIVCIGI